MNKTYFLQLANYNVWANAKAISWLKQINDTQWEQSITSSFSSVRQTALHIASAEKIWIDFWTKAAEPQFISGTFKGSKDELIAIWEQASLGMRDFVESYHADFMEPVLFKYPRGGEAQLPFAHTIAHVMNHSSYHRGQLVTLLRQVGFTDLSSVDLATFYRQMPIFDSI